MAKTFTPQVSERTKEAIVLCEMAEEFGDRLSEFYEKYKSIIDLSNIVEACNDMAAVRNDIALFLSDSVSIDRNLDEIETK